MWWIGLQENGEWKGLDWYIKECGSFLVIWFEWVSCGLAQSKYK